MEQLGRSSGFSAELVGALAVRKKLFRREATKLA
jgi:hypothetical protein